jgi:hypothetical protein
MADHSSPIPFENIPLEQARTMSRGLRRDPDLYNAFKEKIQSLGNSAIRLTISDGTNPTTVKNRILRVAGELKISVTIRRVPGGLLFWRSTNEDIQHATETVQRLRGRQERRRSRRCRRRRA